MPEVRRGFISSFDGKSAVTHENTMNDRADFAHMSEIFADRLVISWLKEAFTKLMTDDVTNTVTTPWRYVGKLLTYHFALQLDPCKAIDGIPANELSVTCFLTLQDPSTIGQTISFALRSDMRILGTRVGVPNILELHPYALDQYAEENPNVVGDLNFVKTALNFISTYMGRYCNNIPFSIIQKARENSGEALGAQKLLEYLRTVDVSMLDVAPDSTVDTWQPLAGQPAKPTVTKAIPDDPRALAALMRNIPKSE